MRAETRYARTGDTHIAYQALGQGPPYVVYVPNWFTDIEGRSTIPVFSRLTQRLASFSRLLSFDQPGTGHSDPVALDRLPTLEEFADSIRAVLDDAGIERAALFAYDYATSPAVMFAATYPERTSALVIHNGTARLTADVDYAGLHPDVVAQVADASVTTWSTPASALLIFPSMAGDDEACEAYVRYQRQVMSPGVRRVVVRMVAKNDVRPLLPVVACPTLVFCTTGSGFVPVGHSRYVAEHIPDAKIVEVESADQVPYDQSVFEQWMTEIQEFLTGERPPPAVGERFLATVLFTDIVASTERLAEVSDRRWSELLNRHNDIVDRCITDFRGKHVNSTGDGVLATFDGPARAIRCACAIRDSLKAFGLDVRAGLHTGEIELAGDDVRGIAVHVGARVSALAGPGEVLVSSTVVDLVAGSGLEFEDRGEHELKGVPRPWRLFAVKP